jgi:2-dehydropantoate 2-reductase
MRVVVLGAGAMGCLYGGLLAATGQDVTMVDVSAEQIDAIRSRGLSLERAAGTVVVQLPIGDAAAAAARPGSPDLVIVFTKTLHSRAALASAQPLLGPETWVLTLQNGLGNVELIEEHVPRARIIQGVTTFPSDLIGPGQVRSLGEGVTRIMSADGTLSPRLREVREALDAAGLHCETAPDVTVAIWEKVAFNAATNALTAVTGLNVGQLADSPGGREMARTIVREVASVAVRKGIAVREGAVLATLDDAFAQHREHKPSMLQDMLRGRHTEIDSLNGAVVREADALGMRVPVTETLHQLVRIMEGRESREG